jgi:phenylacetic acid degradation operon negative regulatory protein
VVVTRAAETNRAGRHLLRTRLRWSGFGSLAPGVWICTHRDRAADAELVLREAGVFEECQIFLSEYLTGGDQATLVRQAWDLDEVEREYESFLAGFARPPSDDPLVRITQLVHEWRRVHPARSRTARATAAPGLERHPRRAAVPPPAREVAAGRDPRVEPHQR